MKWSTLTFAAGAAATGFLNAPSFNCPSNPQDKCVDNQFSGWDFADLNVGSFSSYNGFSWSGFACKEDTVKRSRVDRRCLTGGCSNRYITGVCGSEKASAPSFGCGSNSNKFSLKELHVSTEFDCDLEFHYAMPDGSSCKHRTGCSAGGSVITNDQCGGATSVTVVYPSQTNKPKPSCSISVSTISFECSTSTSFTKTKTKSTKTWHWPSASTSSVPVFTPSSSSVPGVPSSPSSSIPTVPATSTSVPVVPSSSSVPGVPSSSVPGVPSSSVPGVPSSSVPGVPSTTSVPGVPSSTSVPVVPSSSVPGVPSSSVPVTPSSSSVPVVPSSSVPVGNNSVPATSVPTVPFSSIPGTTSVPATSVPATSVPATPSSSVPGVPSSSSVRLTTSTIYTTSVSTVISCAPTITNCPAESVQTTIVTIPVSTTICPVTETSPVPTGPATTPGETVPATTPGQSVPATTPGQSVPATTPGETVPATTPGQSVPATTPAQSSATKPGESVPATTPGQSVPATTPAGSPSTTLATVPQGGSETKTETAPVSTETLPCPDVVPQCLNTWLFATECQDNTDATCLCPDSNYVDKVFGCIYAHGASDDEVAEAVSYFQGLCAGFANNNPAVITGAQSATTYLTVTATQHITQATYTTIIVQATVPVPATDKSGSTVPGSTVTTVISTEATVPQVGFATGSTGVNVVPVSSVFVPTATATATAPAATAPAESGVAKPSGTAASSGFGKTTPVPTATGVVTAGGARAQAYGLAGVVVMAVMAAL